MNKMRYQVAASDGATWYRIFFMKNLIMMVLTLFESLSRLKGWLYLLC